MKANYKIDFTTMTLTMSKAFAEAAYNPTSAEYKTLKRLQKDFPNLTIAQRTHRSPKTANPNKGLTYEKMERYIKVYDNAAELLSVFEKVKAIAATQKNGYAIVKNWFFEQFPAYDKMPSMVDGKLIVIPVMPFQKEVA